MALRAACSGIEIQDYTHTPSLCREEEVTLVCRPGRFGKSLTLSMLQYFHGFEHRARYEELFGELAVNAAVAAGEVKPGRYVGIDFNFATLRAAESPESIRQQLNMDLNGTITNFMRRHPWMKWDMTRKSAAPNFGQFLSEVAKNIQSANTDEGTPKQLRGVEGVC